MNEVTEVTFFLQSLSSLYRRESFLESVASVTLVTDPQKQKSDARATNLAPRMGEPIMTREELQEQIERKGRAMLTHFRLDSWRVKVACEEDDTGNEDNIKGSYGRCFVDEKLIWLNGRYAGSPQLVEDIIRHEIAHALLRGGANHGPEFVAMAKKVSEQGKPR